jgi:FkbM family methyltransferase
MLNTTVITLVDGVQIVVPDSLELITPYVLQEQQDFFEDELPFLRRILAPGERAIDIGANYGVYALSMAKILGPSGHVWAFEPASETAHLLAQSIARNSHRNVSLQRLAVSHAPGTAVLGLDAQPELNSIARGSTSPLRSETVAVTSLDECMTRYGWRDIDFVKIDAEGEETNIVEGGSQFFAELSPLVQYELRKRASAVNYEVIGQFAERGYDSYRLVPGLGVLAPFDPRIRPDPYLLNLFSCKPERAAQLAARGFLVPAAALSGESTNAGEDPEQGWQAHLAMQPYASPFLAAWAEWKALHANAELARALSLHWRSRDSRLSMPSRLRALTASLSALQRLCDIDPSRLRLASLARIAHEYGERDLSVDALKRLLEQIRRAGIETTEPFLAPLERFESIPSASDPSRWLVAAVLEHLELRERFSSFYGGAASLERLEDIQALGLGSAEMERRLRLVKERLRSRRLPP